MIKRKRKPRVAGLPATYDEAKAAALKSDAVIHARCLVRMIRDEKIMWFGVPLSWYAKPDNDRWGKLWLKRMAADADGLINLCNLGRVGWGPAHEVLCELIGEYRFNRASMPLHLEAYDDEVVRAAAADPNRYRRIKGRRWRSENLLRDIATVFTVGDVCWKFGLKPTRNPASKKLQFYGCPVTALAMAEERVAISEPTVVGIWTRLGQMAFPGGIPKPETYPF